MICSMRVFRISPVVRGVLVTMVFHTCTAACRTVYPTSALAMNSKASTCTTQHAKTTAHVLKEHLCHPIAMTKSFWCGCVHLLALDLYCVAASLQGMHKERLQRPAYPQRTQGMNRPFMYWNIMKDAVNEQKPRKVGMVRCMQC